MQNAIGGENVTVTVQGRERYPVNVRYMRDFRSDLGALGRVLVPASEGRRQMPLAQLADIKIVSGPSMIRDEDGMLTGYVYVDLAGRDPSGYVEEAPRAAARENRSCRPATRSSGAASTKPSQRVRRAAEAWSCR